MRSVQMTAEQWMNRCRRGLGATVWGKRLAAVIEQTSRTSAIVEVELVVRDTGRGVAPNIKDKMFEPFFTTRHGEGGTGLGLSIVFNIVTKLLGGTIRVESAPGAGTAMIVRIPTTAPAASGVAGGVYEAEPRKAA